MSNDNKRRTPWGDAKAVIERDKKTVWVTLGPVWETESGGLSFTLESEPFAWRSPNAERRIIITKRDESKGGRR